MYTYDKINDNSPPEIKELYKKYISNEKFIIFHKNSLLLNGNALDKNIFDENTFDLIITSPPYNLNIKYNFCKDDLSYEKYLNFSEKWISNCFYWAKNQGRFCLNIPFDININKLAAKRIVNETRILF